MSQSAGRYQNELGLGGGANYPSLVNLAILWPRGGRGGRREWREARD